MAKPKRSPVTVRGAWFAMPVAFLRSRACAELSPQGLKMLMDLCAQLGPNARGNGDLSASPATLGPRGWASNATRDAAIQELTDAGLVAVTRIGGRRRCALYAVTLWPLDCDFTKLDHGPGVCSTIDWERGGADEPTAEHPAVWRRVRKNAIAFPATGQPPADMTPPRGNLGPAEPSYDPATGSYRPFSAPEVAPPGGTFLDSHLVPDSSAPLAALADKGERARRPMHPNPMVEALLLRNEERERAAAQEGSDAG